MKKFKGILKVTNKKSGFYHYFNPTQAATFISKNGSTKYKVKEIKEIDFEEIMYFFLTCVLNTTLIFASIYFS